MKNRVDGLSRGRGINADRFISAFYAAKAPLQDRNETSSGEGVGLFFNPAPLPLGESGFGQRPRSLTISLPKPKQNALGDNDDEVRGGGKAEGSYILFAKHIFKELSCKAHQ
jgi:hypothetical protein